MQQQLRKIFVEKFQSTPLVVKSPGRINLIGEHTDYNEGFVLPASIDKYIHVAIGKRKDDTIHLYSLEYKESQTASLQDLSIPGKQWPVYVLGVVDQLQKNGYRLSGFNLMFDGDIPIGAGMSSSAAVECATSFALNELFGLGIPKIEMVKMAQLAEHEFAGVKCGIMDQFASMFGKAGHVIRLDCRSLEYGYVPFDMKGIKIVLLDTNVKHSLASSAYNERRTQCEAGVAKIQQHIPGVKSLRDATIKMLGDYVTNPVVYQRCKYVVEEIERLQYACADLNNGDIDAFGKKMFATHDGLSKLYEVSCAELDCLVDAVRIHPSVLGARMMGGGFGGCTINLVEETEVEKIINTVSETYKNKMNKELTAYVVNIESGTCIEL
ncbi:MAG: galactokinase [Chitinophagales bacterium]|nr:galactokinase [Chitinophagales bacterium]